MKDIKADWQGLSSDVFVGVSNLSDSLYDFEKVRIEISKKLKFLDDEKSEKLGELLADAESAMMDIEQNMEALSAIGNFIDEEVI